MMRRGYRSPCSIVSKTSLLRNSLKRSATHASDRVRDTVRRLRPTEDEARECRNARRESLRRKNARATVFDPRAVWDEAMRCAEDPSAGLYDRILALLLLTGRRQSELLNGRGSLRLLPADEVATPEARHVAVFDGQLKRRRRGASTAYRIPLLCRASTARRLLASVRSDQPEDVSTRTNAQISATYSSGLGTHLRAHAVYGKYFRRVHDLRGAYAVMVYHWFDVGDASQNYVTMKVLGQGSLADALSYTTFASRGAFPLAPRQFGRFAIE